jgi:hypothetical protein
MRFFNFLLAVVFVIILTIWNEAFLCSGQQLIRVRVIAALNPDP